MFAKVAEEHVGGGGEGKRGRGGDAEAGEQTL
jgi:hypothetical protein